METVLGISFLHLETEVLGTMPIRFLPKRLDCSRITPHALRTARLAKEAGFDGGTEPGAVWRQTRRR